VRVVFRAKAAEESLVARDWYEERRAGLGNEFTAELKKVPATFYRTPAGTEPVREWLQGLERTDRQRIGADIATVEYGWPVGMPVARSLGRGLWEVRTNLDRNRTARVFFCFADGRMILLHGFMKKTRTTPARVLLIARNRQEEVGR